MVRNSLKFVRLKDQQKAIAAGLKEISSVLSEDMALDELETFAKDRNLKCPMFSRS